MRDIVGEDGRISMRLATLTETLVIKKIKVELTSTIKRIVRDLKPKARSRPCSLILEGDWDSTIHVYATELSIHDIFENILDNAIKYSFSDRVIQISLFKKGTDVRISVTNHGIGIPEKTMKKIHEREFFTRSNVQDPIRDDRTGTGLGLVMVQDELDMCGGILMVESNPPPQNPLVIFAVSANMNGSLPPLSVRP